MKNTWPCHKTVIILHCLLRLVSSSPPTEETPSELCHVHGIPAESGFCQVQHRVTTGTAQKCWKYCSFLDSCELFAFNRQESLCYLYNQYICDHIDDEAWISGAKMCINHVKETEDSITLPDFLRDGGHIKKKSSTKCLGFTEDETQRYDLTWTTCVPSNKWIAVMEGEGEVPQVRITQPDTDMCLTTEPFPELPGAGYLEPSVYLAVQPCSESGISPLFLDSYFDTSHSAKLVDYFFVTTHDRVVQQWPADPSITRYQTLLFGVVSASDKLTGHCAACPVEDGDIIVADLSSTVPIYLSGDVVTVRCNAGFRIKHHSLAEEATTTCVRGKWQDVTMVTRQDGCLECVRVKSREEQKKRRQRKRRDEVTSDDAYLVTLVGGLLIIGVVIFLIILYKWNHNNPD